ncbi:MAG: D-alanyl-D-alanine carboxypeptidase family protein [Hyphomicrobium sp.]
MRKRFSAAVATLCAVLAAGPVVAGPALLFDPEDGKILYAEEPDSQWHPASLTKIMTAYLTFDALKKGRLTLDTKIACSAGATQVQPSKLGLPVGAEITVAVALQALIIKSANDVAIMLAEAIAGSEPAFVAEMNAAARRLGMTRTTFVNPNGLPSPAQVTTARDLAKLGRSVLRDFPEYASYWGQREVLIGKTRLVSHNGLLKTFEGADGLKTGFICDSGFNVVASATRDGKRLMAVVLGEQTGVDRTLRAASLLEHGYQQLGWKQLFNATTIDNLPVPPDAKGITSMRQTVVSWECGTGRPPRAVVAARRAKIKAAKAAKAKAQAAALAKANAGAAPPAAGAPAAPAPAKPKVPKPADAAKPAAAPAAASAPVPAAQAAPAAPAVAPAPAKPAPVAAERATPPAASTGVVSPE